MDTHRKRWRRLVELTAWRMSLPEEQQSLRIAGARLGVSAAQMLRYETGERRIPPHRVEAVSMITVIEPTKLRPDIYPEGFAFPLRRRAPRVLVKQLAVD